MVAPRVIKTNPSLRLFGLTLLALFVFGALGLGVSIGLLVGAFFL